MKTNPIAHPARERGSSLLELLVAMGILMLIIGTVLDLADLAQFRHTSEQDFLSAVQMARQGVDQIMYDVHRAGYPSPFLYTATPDDPSTAPATLQRRFSVGFVGLPAQTCQTGSTCTVPNGFDLLLEGNPDPLNPIYQEQVQWVEYRLVRPTGSATGTLMRSMTPKTIGTDPIAGANLVPIVANVLNDPSNPADAIFTYSCAGATPCATPSDIRQVRINLRVQSFHADPKTRQFRQITLSGLAQRMNPVP